MYLPTAAGQSSLENETKKPFGWHSLPANCNGPASAPTAKMPASTNDLNTGMSVFEAPSPVTKDLGVVDELRCSLHRFGRIGLVVDHRVLDRQTAELVAELFEGEIDATLGFGAC